MTTSTPLPGWHLSEASYVDMDVIEQVELPEQVKGKLEYHSSPMNPIESEDELTTRGYEKEDNNAI